MCGENRKAQPCRVFLPLTIHKHRGAFGAGWNGRRGYEHSLVAEITGGHLTNLLPPLFIRAKQTVQLGAFQMLKCLVMVGGGGGFLYQHPIRWPLEILNVRAGTSGSQKRQLPWVLQHDGGVKRQNQQFTAHEQGCIRTFAPLGAKRAYLSTGRSPVVYLF